MYLVRTRVEETTPNVCPHTHTHTHTQAHTRGVPCFGIRRERERENATCGNAPELARAFVSPSLCVPASSRGRLATGAGADGCLPHQVHTPPHAAERRRRLDGQQQGGRHACTHCAASPGCSFVCVRRPRGEHAVWLEALCVRWRMETCCALSAVTLGTGKESQGSRQRRNKEKTRDAALSASPFSTLLLRLPATYSKPAELHVAPRAASAQSADNSDAFYLLNNQLSPPSPFLSLPLTFVLASSPRSRS